jgi:hypothetical protein
VKLTALVLLAVSFLAVAQEPLKTPALTDAEVQAAIDRGSSGKPHTIGLQLHDVENSAFSSLSCSTCGQTDYFVTVYTPSQWIEAAAAAAKNVNKTFSLANVSDAMRRPVLRVTAQQIRNSGGRRVPPTPIQQVTLTDQAKKEIIQPLVERGNQQALVQNGDRGSIDASSAGANFDMAAVHQVAGKGDFFIVVTNDNGAIYLKVKVRDLQ